MLDYGSRINRVLYESNPNETKHYLYDGDLCLAEFVTDEVEEETEWRYYLYDGNGYVRQTVDENATPTYAWTFSPEGAVLLGEEGPVTHLSCNGDAVYDWSTGLIYKNGNYFDPNTGIWLTIGVVVASSNHQRRKRRGKRKGKEPTTYIWLAILLLLLFLLAGCGGPTPTPIGNYECPTPTATELPLPAVTPTLPSPIVIVPPTQQPEQPAPETPTPEPTVTPTIEQQPTLPPGEFRFTGIPVDSIDTSRDGGQSGYSNGVQGFGATQFAKTSWEQRGLLEQSGVVSPYADYTGTSWLHAGVDFASDSGDPVYARISGTIWGDFFIDAAPFVWIKEDTTGKMVLYGHTNLAPQMRPFETKVTPNDIIGYLADNGDPHVHLSIYDSPIISYPRAHNPLKYFESDVRNLFSNQMYTAGQDAFSMDSFNVVWGRSYWDNPNDADIDVK